MRKVAGQEDPDKKETGSEEEEGMLWKASRKGVRGKERPQGAGAQGQGCRRGPRCCQLAASRPRRETPGTPYLRDYLSCPAVGMSTGFRRVQDRNCVMIMLKPPLASLGCP